MPGLDPSADAWFVQSIQKDVAALHDKALARAQDLRDAGVTSIAVVFLQDQGLRTLMVGLTIFNSRYRVNVPVVMAGMLWATVPMVTLYLLGQRFFIRGLTAGAVKG